jgi:hypothetical protein
MKKINSSLNYKLSIFIMIFGLVLASCSKAAKTIPDIDYETETGGNTKIEFKTLNYLKSVSGSKTITGQQGRAWWQPMKDISGKYPGLFGEDFSFANFFGGTSLANSRDILADECIKRWNEGQIIALMWHPCPPTFGEPCAFEGGNENKNVKSKLTDEQWTALITEGTPLNNSWKRMIDGIVPSMQKNAKLWRRDFMEAIS